MSHIVQNAIGFCKGVGPKSNTSFCEGSTSRKERRTNYLPLACFFPFFLFLVDFSTSAYVALSSPAKNFTQAYKRSSIHNITMIHYVKQEESARERALCQLTECF